MTTIAELVSLAGRTAVVTGGAQGIGAAIVARFREAGSDVHVLDRQGPEPVDVADPQALTRAAARLPKVDIWVNNAGIAPRKSVLDIALEEWDEVMALNLRAALVGAQLAARHMIAAGGPGVILNIASSAVQRVSSNSAHYRASKVGLVALTQNLAVELGKHGIRVVGIAPTLTETPLVGALRQSGIRFDEFVKRLPLRRIATADEVARVALFAASDLASFVTGTTIDVDGGESQK